MIFPFQMFVVSSNFSRWKIKGKHEYLIPFMPSQMVPLFTQLSEPSIWGRKEKSFHGRKKNLGQREKYQSMKGKEKRRG